MQIFVIFLAKYLHFFAKTTNLFSIIYYVYNTGALNRQNLVRDKCAISA